MHPSRPEAHRAVDTRSRVAGTHRPAVDSHSRVAGTHSWAEALLRRAAQPPGQATCLQEMQRQARQPLAQRRGQVRQPLAARFARARPEKRRGTSPQRRPRKK